MEKNQIRHELRKLHPEPYLRLGQIFCNLYIRHSWPRLFHETDENKALDMIKSWLDDHQYYDSLPDIS